MSLIFPYKDCILQGGQTKEDAKRNEIFYNQILAPDQIDRLLDKKVFTSFKRVDHNKEQELDNIQDITKENLIVKGNNLLALHSLKHIYRGKVKLIYIDPPYNTGGDANIFTYNNSFNHSTWLTFMKNRLEVAKEFLQEDGFIAIAIDHYELFYLGTLADEIFGRENRLGVITIVHKPEGRQFAKGINPTNEFMLIYSKIKSKANLFTYPIDDEKLEKFDEEDEKGKFKWINYIRLGGGDVSLRINNKRNWYPIYVSIDLKKVSLNKKEDWYEVFPITDKGIERTWNTSKKEFLDNINNGNIRVVKENKNLKVERKYRANQMIKTHWDKSKYNATRYGTQELNKIIGKGKFSYPKSLYTVLDTLKITTDKDDIIMDFHAGSGTTGHAVLELNKEDGGNRKFILVEQLDEHIAICKERIQKVIQGYIKKEKEKENTLSSTNKIKELEKLNFIYCELAEYNQKFISQIEQAKETKTLISIYNDMKENGFLSYQFNDKEFSKRQKEFKTLSLEEQKKVLLDLLDKNMLYLNYDDLEDNKYKLDKTTIRLNKDFYGI